MSLHKGSKFMKLAMEGVKESELGELERGVKGKWVWRRGGEAQRKADSQEPSQTYLSLTTTHVCLVRPEPLTNVYNQIWFCICFWDMLVLVYSLFL